MERREVEIVQDGPTRSPRLVCDGVELWAKSVGWSYDPVDGIAMAQIELPAQVVRLRTMAEFEIPGERELLGAADFALEALEGGDPSRLQRARRVLAGGLDAYRTGGAG